MVKRSRSPSDSAAVNGRNGHPSGSITLNGQNGHPHLAVVNGKNGTTEKTGKYGYTNEGKKKRILLNAFDMNGVGHISPGQWQNPQDQSKNKNRLDYWINLAKLLDKGKFNALFLADNFGSHDVYGGNQDASIKSGTQWPLYDPFVIVSAMAAVTKSVAFGITSCTTFEPPFLLAKRFSTLDHVTKGRIAWNIVTSWSDNAAKAVGLPKLPEHDSRYEIADEYLTLMYKLWEGSWADDAVVQDSVKHVFADPAKIRKIEHRGKYFKSISAHQVDPSPQRTPVLFQAGMSPAGSAFAAKHAECIFLGGKSPAFVAEKIGKTRALAASHGRDPSQLKFFVQFTPILGATDEEAKAKHAEHIKNSIPEGGLSLFGGVSGIDLSKFPLDEEFPTDPKNPLYNGISASGLERLLHPPDNVEKWTPRIMAGYLSLGGSGVVVVGSGETVAKEMERWILNGDIDGFNVGHVVVPQAWEDVIEFLIPELEKKGWLGEGEKAEYPAPGATARENLYATPGNSRLREGHPGNKYRFDVYPEEPEWNEADFVGIK